MDIIVTFLVILAYVFGTINGVLFALKTHLAIKYEGSLEQALDRVKGQRTVYRTKVNAIAFLICVIFLIAYHLS